MLNKTIINLTIGIFLILVVFVVGVRFFGGDEDAWLCDGGQWVRHGNPSSSMPDSGCGEDTVISEKTEFSVYFGNSKFNANIQDCSLVFPVEREISKTLAVGQMSLEELFKGPTAEEQKNGYTSFFSDATKDILKSIKIDNKIAYVDLKDIRQLIPNASSSCGSAQFLSEMTNTLKQFSSIERVVFAIEGNPITFYEWLQLDCNANNNCDAKPFQ
jgi:hypothetical protein